VKIDGAAQALEEERDKLVRQLAELGATETGELTGDVDYGDGFADAAAAAMIAGLTEQTAPGAVVVITGIRVQNSDGDSALPREAGQTAGCQPSG